MGNLLTHDAHQINIEDLVRWDESHEQCSILAQKYALRAVRECESVCEPRATSRTCERARETQSHHDISRR